LKLRRLAEVFAGGAVGLDDVLGQQVSDVIAARGNVGGEEVIERAVFPDKNDYVLDGRFGCVMMVVIVITG
jgi:hypothetical protein